MIEPGTIIALVRASLTTINSVRNIFPIIVQQQLDMAERYLNIATNTNKKSDLIYAIQVMETAVNQISRSKWNGPLYFLGNEKHKNVEKYNSLCRIIAKNHNELGNCEKASIWYNKQIDEYWNDPDYDCGPIPGLDTGNGFA